MTCHPARAGVVIATGETLEEARDRAVKAVAKIRIETEP
jgi:formate-dependent phosphoribosylglycinamide formyltransferase (GAR transformylase)